MYAIYEIATGQIKSFTRRGQPHDGHAAHAVTDDLPSADDFYLPGGVMTPRPARAAIPESGVAPMTLDPAIFPAGSTITVSNESGDQWNDLDPTDASDPVVLQDAGTYVLRLSAPFPEQSFTLEIAVA